MAAILDWPGVSKMQNWKRVTKWTCWPIFSEIGPTVLEKCQILLSLCNLYVKFATPWRPSWISDKFKKYKLGRAPTKEYACDILKHFAKWFQRRCRLKFAKFCSIFSNGGHLGLTWVIKNTNLKETHPMNILTKFRWNLTSDFGEDDFVKMLTDGRRTTIGTNSSPDLSGELIKQEALEEPETLTLWRNWKIWMRCNI